MPSSTPDEDLPASLKAAYRRSLLEQASDDDCLGLFEISLFEYYLKENSATIERMLASEKAYLDEQQRAGAEILNDSGIVAAEYFTKRIRYADVIYLCSLVETFLFSACKKLEFVRNDAQIRFNPSRSGSKWQQAKDFLEKRGGLVVPELSQDELQRCRIVRNCVAHNNGDTSGLSVKDRTRLSAAPGIKVNGYEIVVEHEFVQRSFEAFKGLVDRVSSQLNAAIKDALGKEGAPTSKASSNGGAL